MNPIHPEIIREAKNELARRCLCDFATVSDDNYTVNWHHRVLCDYLDRFAKREIPRLMVFMPPRHGKSELVSRKLPAFLFGKNPDTSVIAVSYSGDLAMRMNRDVQRIIDSDEYSYIFPDTCLFGKNIRTVADGSYLRNSDVFEIVGRRGSYRSAGVGGGITGMGGEYIIIDDPLKNREEASSLTIREKIWEWYTSTLYTRLEKDGCILLTMTRWHEDDLAGRLLSQAESDPDADQWEVVTFPATAEAVSHPYDIRNEGDPLWNDKYNSARLVTIKSSIGSYDWNALYQQHPTSPEGGLFKREHWRYWKELPKGISNWVQSWDCSFKATNTSSYVVGQVWAKSGADRYLIDQVRKRMTFTETLQAIRNMTKLYPKTRRKLIEDKANGSAVIDTLKKEITGLIPVNPEGGKESRAQAVSPAVESGNVYLPFGMPWLGDFIDEFAAFPNGSNDDQVDAMTQANIYYGKRSFNVDILAK